MRVLQSTYWLEPAGSHGVWGLDDYHFLPFLWGAAQLQGGYNSSFTYGFDIADTTCSGHKYIRPKSIHDSDTVEEFSKHYMYLACIKFINSVRSFLNLNHPSMISDGSPDQDRFIAMALTFARRHLCGTP